MNDAEEYSETLSELEAHEEWLRWEDDHRSADYTSQDSGRDPRGSLRRESAPSSAGSTPLVQGRPVGGSPLSTMDYEEDGPPAKIQAQDAAGTGSPRRNPRRNSGIVAMTRSQQKRTSHEADEAAPSSATPVKSEEASTKQELYMQEIADLRRQLANARLDTAHTAQELAEARKPRLRR